MIMPAITQIRLASRAVISGEKFCLALVCHTLHAHIEGVCLNVAGDTWTLVFRALKSFSFLMQHQTCFISLNQKVGPRVVLHPPS